MFNEKFNTDDVIFRSLTVGLLNFLSNKVQIKQALDANNERFITIPFFPAMYGDERFLQDFYTLYGADCNGLKVEGNYDPVPRGELSLTSFTINSAALTNKFVRGTYNKEVDGQVRAYSSFLNVIPLAVIWDIEIISSSLVESYKIIQEVISTFYKAATFNVDYSGFMIPCQVGFSEDYNIDKPVTFTYGDADASKITIKFTIEMEAYLPVIDQKNEMFRGRVMSNGIGSVIERVSGVSGSSGYNKVVFQADVDFGLNKILDQDVKPPDEKAPYGYDKSGNIITPGNSLNLDHDNLETGQVPA